MDYDLYSKKELKTLADGNGLPLFVYYSDELNRRSKQLMGLDLPYGLTVRYAVKANPHKEIVKIFTQNGLHFDASSSYEAVELLDMGVSGDKISLSSQQPANNLEQLLESGVLYVATSIHQLELFAEVAKPGAHLALRVNPGLGAGHSNRVTTGGANSSFGLWNTYIPDALAVASSKGLIIDRLQVHIGAGADPHVWSETIKIALELAEQMQDVVILDIGGGYKVHRFGDEHETDMAAVAKVFSEALVEFADRTGRKLKLEIEPGTWLVTHAGVLLAEIVDIVDTGADGHRFIKLNTGMNDFIRPSMYGAQHEIEVLNDSTEVEDYVVVGHNCETGDILTPATGDPEGIESRELKRANIGDIVAICDTGSYCATFSTTGYNSYPSAKEVII